MALLVEDSSVANRADYKDGYLSHEAEEIAVSFLKSPETKITEQQNSVI